MLSQETVKKKKRYAETVMSADTEDVLIETPCLYQKGLRDTLAQCSNRFSTSQASQVPTVPRVSSPASSVASGSQIRITVTEAPMNLSQYSLTNLGHVVKAGSSNICLCGSYFESLNV